MVRFMFRALSFAALLLAVVTATMDSIQSVSSSQVMLTSLQSAWQDLDGQSLVVTQTLLDRWADQQLLQDAADWVLQQPAFSVFLVFSLLFWMIGYRRPPQSRFAG